MIPTIIKTSLECEYYSSANIIFSFSSKSENFNRVRIIKPPQKLRDCKIQILLDHFIFANFCEITMIFQAKFWWKFWWKFWLFYVSSTREHLVRVSSSVDCRVLFDLQKSTNRTPLIETDYVWRLKNARMKFTEKMSVNLMYDADGWDWNTNSTKIRTQTKTLVSVIFSYFSLWYYSHWRRLRRLVRGLRR